MNTEHLNYFLELLNCASLTKASEKLFISRPALKANISSLEKELGGSLVVYNKHGVTPTDFGMKIASEANIILNCINTWKSYADSKSTMNNVLNVYTDRAFSNTILTPFLISMSQQSNHPFKIFTREDSAYNTFNAIKHGQCHIGIIGAFTSDYYNLKLLLSSSNWQIKELFQDYFYVFLNKSHPLAQNDIIDIAALTNSSLIMNSNPQHFSSLYGIEKLFGGITPKISLYLESFQSIINTLAFYPELYAIFSKFLVMSDQYKIHENMLCTKPLTTTEKFPSAYYIICQQEDLQSSAERDFIHELVIYLNNIGLTNTIK